MLSTQISNSDTEDEDGDLDDEMIELFIDIEMVFMFLPPHLYTYVLYAFLVRYCIT